MDAIEIESFLQAHRTGTLSLADDGEAYAIPVSFVYEPTEQAIFFRLGYAPGSQKRRYVDATERASFVVYAETGDGWKSVVVVGPLEAVSETTLDSSIEEAIDGLQIPYFLVFERPVDEIEFHVVRLDVRRVTGLVAN